jgi:serine/threonine protein kinase
MGEVYRARDTRLDRLVAIEVLASHLSSSPALRQRLEPERVPLARLSIQRIGHHETYIVTFGGGQGKCQ